ncbi:MAG: hypothetical protein QG622_1771 [Actinomycetota bacterium]|nr:hypothetical protein [Actinomycetota bacterium]
MSPVVGIRGSGFVGRAQELSRLEEFLTATADGGCGVLVGGDAGVGKTRLLTEFVTRATEGGALTVVGRCVDLGAGGLPYLPFSEVVASLLGLTGEPGNHAAAAALRKVAQERPSLSRVTGQADGQPGVDEASQRLALYDAVATALKVTAQAAGPLLLVLEDLHWADASSRDLLRFLLSRLGDDPVLIVGTYRSDDLHRRHPLRGLLAELVRLPRVTRLDLRPFDEVELRRYLVTLHGGELAEQVVQDIAVRSEGNAFYAAELLVSTSGDGSVPLPWALADVLLARMEQLPEPVQNVARVAAVAGRRVSDTLLRQALALAGGSASDAAPGEAEGDIHEVLRSAVTHQVLVPDGSDRFAFRHALVQEAVYTDLLPGERARLHRLYADLLASDPDPATAADLARHSVEAHDLPSALAAWLRAAREAGRRLAPAEALTHYDRVLRLWPSVPADRRPAGTEVIQVKLDAAKAASASGELLRAIALGRAAATAAGTAGDVELEAHARSCLATYLVEDDQVDPALEQVHLVYALLDGQGPRSSRVWAATVEARITTGRGDLWDCRRGHLLRTRDLVEKALAEAWELGMVAAEADLFITLAQGDALVVGPEAATARLEEAARRGAEAGDPQIELRVAFYLGLFALDVGDLATSRRHLERGLAGAERAGLASCLFAIESRLLLAQVLEIAGEWEDVERTVTTDRPRLPVRESLFMMVPLLPVLAARDPSAAIDRAAALEACDEAYPIMWHLVYAPWADALTWLGRHEEALEAVRKAFASFERIGRPLAIAAIRTAALGIAVLADAARSGVRLPEASQEGPELLERARRAAATGATKMRFMGPEGRAWLARAEAEATRLTGPGDVAAWRAAVDAFRTGHVYEEARSRWRLAEALLASGGRRPRDEATALLRDARRTVVGLRAVRLRAAIDATAARHRLDLGGGVVGQRILTPREEEVICLVAEGLTNRGIGTRLAISEKTASVHVSNLMAKLGASGRAEAVSVAHRLGLLGPADAG